MEPKNQDRLRISLLNDSFPPTIDGVANAVVNYAEVLHRHGDEVLVATPAYPNVEDHYAFPVLRYPSFGLSDNIGYRAGSPFSPELIHLLEQQKPDIIHTHCPVVSTMLARMLRERTHAPIVFTYHTKFDIDIKKSVRGKLLQQASVRALINNISACDEVWAVSEGAGKNLESLGYEGPWRVMENGVDFPRGRAPQSEIEAVRAQYGLAPDMPVFLFVGRMMWYKGIRLSLDGLRAARAQGEDFRFLLVGDGLDRKEIEAYIEEIGLSDRCIFTGAIRDREKLRAIFCSADLFLFPSSFDTNGIVVREAAACSCPSLLLRGSCAAEGVTDGRTGLLIREDTLDMTEAIVWACHNRARLAEIGPAAADGIYLSWEDAVLRARERYGEVAEAYRAGRLSHTEVPGDDFYAGTARMLAGLGKAAPPANLEKGYSDYMAYLREREAPLEENRKDSAALLHNLKKLWEDQNNQAREYLDLVRKR